MSAENTKTEVEGAVAFTPGPWVTRPSAITASICIYSSVIADDVGGYGIGEAWNINGAPENAANARLIAAAPELYEVVAKYSHDGHLQTPEDRERFRAEARAALSKADGLS